MPVSVAIQVRGRRHTVGLGGYPLTSLQEAREGTDWAVVHGHR